MADDTTVKGAISTLISAVQQLATTGRLDEETNDALLDYIDKKEFDVDFDFEFDEPDDDEKSFKSSAKKASVPTKTK